MDTASLDQKFKKVIDLFTSDIAQVRTGRVNASLVENITCPAYGGTQMLRVMELGTITSPDPYTLVITPWDKSIIGDIRKGILEANLGMNPSIDGEIIRIAFPPLTTEDREKYVKILSQKLETAKVMTRQVRADAMQEIKSDFEKKVITEDQKQEDEKKVQEATDKAVSQIESLAEKKKQELLQI